MTNTGNTLSHSYDGTISVKLDHTGEVYAVMLPAAVTRGIINGRTTTHVQGTVTVACEATGVR